MRALTGLVPALALLMASAAHACGYHSPQDMARGLLNWAYPNALYVQTAVWQAENHGVLPPRERQKARDLFAYHRMVTSLQQLGARLPSAGAEPVSFSAVLIDSMLWVRFSAETDGYAVQPHIDGPLLSDVVMVTDGKVIPALASGSLTAVQAESHGLFRLYGRKDLLDQVRNVLTSAVGGQAPRPKAGNAAAKDPAPALAAPWAAE